MSRRDADDRDEPLPDLLAELETTLRDLRGELEPRNGRPPIPRPPTRPPRFRDVLRFTEEYTIPALVAILDANVRLLKLAQAALRAVDPETTVAASETDQPTLRESAEQSGRVASERLSSALSELQRGLSESDLPENPEARRLLSEARELSTEVQRRLSDAGEQTSLGRYAVREREQREQGETAREASSDADEGPVTIEVTGGDEESGGDEASCGDDRASVESGDDGGPNDVDVEAELRSIREDVEGRDENSSGEERASDGDDGEERSEGDSEESGSENGEENGGASRDERDERPDDAGER